MAEAKYKVIAKDLREQIASGELKSGDQLPTEASLEKSYDASRNTIRDAIKRLINQGLVETRPGQGTFVLKPIEPFVTTLTADTETGLGGGEGDRAFSEVRERGKKFSASTPKVEVQKADLYIATRLRVPVDTVVVTRTQQRFIDGTPWSIQLTAYPMELVLLGASDLMEPNDIPGGTVAYLKRALNLVQIGTRDRILVRPPAEAEALFFKLPDDGTVSVVSLVRTAYRAGADGPVPFRVTFTVFPADRNQFVINTGDFPRGLAEAASDQHYKAPQASPEKEPR